MTEKFIFILLIIIAFFIITENNLKRVIIAMGIFSLLASFVYLLFHAPDVALAEAIIGSALSTILYIISLKKYKTFYIFITSNSEIEKNDMRMRLELKSIYPKIMNYCSSNELQVQCVYTHDKPERILKEHVCDLILVANIDETVIYGIGEEIHTNHLKEILKNANEKITFVSLKGGTNENF